MYLLKKITVVLILLRKEQGKNLKNHNIAKTLMLLAIVVVDLM